jgi:apolipoprotein N-acyltransferase
VSAPVPLPRRRASAYALALLVTPVLHGLCFPEARVHWIAWICFVPWFVAIRIAPFKTALLITGATTLLGSYLVTPWLPAAVANYYAQPLSVGIGLFIGVWAVMVAPWVLLFTACYRALARRRGAALPLLAGAAWAGAELARVRLLAGEPFGLLGYTQTGFVPVMQIADITGVYGISFVLAAVNVALAEVWLAVALRRRLVRDALCGLALAAAAVVLVAVYGVTRLHSSTTFRPDGAPTHVAIVQGNLDLGSQWRSDFYGRNLDVYLRLTLQALRDAGPALVFWPESSMTFFLADEPLYQKAIGQILSPSGAQLVAGGPRVFGSGVPRYYNSAFLVAPDGRVLAWYDKQRLLPFAEYFPFASIDLLRREFARVRQFTPGGSAHLLPAVAGLAGVVICNEVMFGEIAGARVAAGAGYLVNLTNDSWLGDSKFAAQALDMGRMRAVEQRRYVVRVSTSGPSAIIDPLGRVTAATASSSRMTIGGTIQAGNAVTLYGRVGDVFGILCAAVPLLVLATAAVRVGNRQARLASSEP